MTHRAAAAPLPTPSPASRLARLAALTEHHRQRCPPYRQLLATFWPDGGHPANAAQVPFVPVGLFKSHRLVSVPDHAIVRELHSSSTTGQTPSRVYLDAATAASQARALVDVMAPVLGNRRLPMLVVDEPGVLARGGALGARGAGVMGMMNFGLRPVFALDARGQLDERAVENFCRQVDGRAALVFGFTFIVWRQLVQALAGRGRRLDLAGATLIHSGGWKKMQAESVGNEAFKAAVRETLGIEATYNFYGMVEQVGAVFVEGRDGLLHTSCHADVLVRRPGSLEEAELGEPGIVEVLSTLPESYPGHALLTEDWGVVESRGGADGGSAGFRVLGRVARAEPRGCGDSHG